MPDGSLKFWLRAASFGCFVSSGLMMWQRSIVLEESNLLKNTQYLSLLNLSQIKETLLKSDRVFVKGYGNLVSDEPLVELDENQVNIQAISVLEVDKSYGPWGGSLSEFDSRRKNSGKVFFDLSHPGMGYNENKNNGNSLEYLPVDISCLSNVPHTRYLSKSESQVGNRFLSACAALLSLDIPYRILTTKSCLPVNRMLFYTGDVALVENRVTLFPSKVFSRGTFREGFELSLRDEMDNDASSLLYMSFGSLFLGGILFMLGREKIRPGSHDKTCATATSTVTLTVPVKNNHPSGSSVGFCPLTTGNPALRTYTFDYVANEFQTQETIFEKIGRPIADSCLTGYHGCIFAYGKTGSGKTYTIQGAVNQAGELIMNERGLIPRILEYLFSQINHRKKRGGVEYLCKCSYLEIYQENITDLLCSETTPPKLQLREDLKHGVYVENLLEIPINSCEEAFKLLIYGAKRRHVAPTLANDQSSRSHAVFTLHIHSKEIHECGAVQLKYARLHIVDLAGSERQKNTETSGNRLKESSNINQSLTTLGQVIRSLSTGSGFVHYRNSKLTFLLKDSLGGNSKTSIIATIDSQMESYGETLSTIKFAQRAKMIRNAAVINEDSSGSRTELQEEIKKLREIIRQREGLNGSSDGGMIHYRGFQTTELEARIVELEQLLKASIFNEKVSQDEKLSCLSKIADLQELCARNESFFQSLRMIIKLREERIKIFEQKNPETSTYSRELEAAKNIELLEYQIDHHPEVLRLTIENIEYRELDEKFQSLYAGDITEVKRLNSFCSNLTSQLQKLISDKHRLLEILEGKVSESNLQNINNSPISASHSAAGKPPKNNISANLEKWKHQQEIESLKARLETWKQQYIEEQRELQTREIEWREELNASENQCNYLENQLQNLQVSFYKEIEGIREKSMADLADTRVQYEEQLQKLQAGVESSKLASVTVLTLERQIAQISEENTKLRQKIEEQEVDRRALKRALNQLEGNQTRMSLVFQNADPMNSTRVSQNFGLLSDRSRSPGYDAFTSCNSSPKTINIASLAAKKLGAFQRRVTELEEQNHLIKDSLTKTELNYSQTRQKLEEELRVTESSLAEKLEFIAEIQQKESALRDENEILSNELDLTKNQLLETDNVCQQLKRQLKASEENIHRLETEKSALKDSMVILRDNLATEKDELVSRLLEKQMHLESQLEHVNQQLKMSSSGLEEEMDKCRKYESENNVLERRIVLMQTEIDRFLFTKAALESKQTEKDSYISEIENKVQLLNEKLLESEKWDERVQELEETNADLQQELTSALETLKEERSALEKSKSQIDHYFEERMIIMQQKQELESENVELQAMLSDLKSRFNEILENGDAEKCAIKIERDEFATECGEQKKIVEKIKKEKVVLDEDICNMREEVDYYKRAFETLRSEHDQLITAYKNISEQKKQLMALKPTYEAQTMEFETKTSQLETEKEILKKRISGLEEENKGKQSYVDENKMLKEQLIELREMKSPTEVVLSLEKQIQSLNAKLNDQEKENKELKLINDKLVNLANHQNSNQKIKIHNAIKVENNQLRHKVSKLRSALLTKDMQIKEFLNQAAPLANKAEQNINTAIKPDENRIEDGHFSKGIKDVTNSAIFR